jgi:hypothetical protein
MTIAKNIAPTGTASAKHEHCSAPSVTLASRWTRPSTRPRLVTFSWSAVTPRGGRR